MSTKVFTVNDSRRDFLCCVLLTDTLRFPQIMSEAEILDFLHSFSVSLLGLCGSIQLHLKEQNNCFSEISRFFFFFTVYKEYT